MSRPRMRKPVVASRTLQRLETAPPPPAAATSGICLEVGAVRIHVGSVAEARELLAPFLRVASRKELAQLLGISPRTLHRWRRAGRLGRTEAPLLADVMRHLATLPGSGEAR